MWQENVRSGIYLAIFVGFTYTSIYGLRIIPDACIEICMCHPVATDRDLSPSERISYRVCGTDGVTYESLCKLECQNCENNMTLIARYYNASNIRIGYKQCNRSSETPKQWKRLFAPKTPKPTGSTTTKKPKPTTPSTPTTPYMGPSTTDSPPCDKEDKANIRWAEANKHIPFKNITFPIKFFHLGECEHNKKDKRSASLSSEDDRIGCTGVCACSPQKDYVCGTNFHSYHNKCRLRCDVCEKQMVIKVAYRGKCRKTDF